MSKKYLGLLCAALSAMSLIKFAEPLRASESKLAAGIPTGGKTARPKETTKVDETELEGEEEAPPPPRSLHELYRHCWSPKQSKSTTSSEEANMNYLQCISRALCTKGKSCISRVQGYGYDYVVEFDELLERKLRGKLKDHAKYIAFTPESHLYVGYTMPEFRWVYFLRNLPQPVKPKLPNSDPYVFGSNESAERIPFEFNFRGKTYEADSLAIVGPLFDFEFRDGYLELPNFAMHDWFAKNFKPDEFRVILWGAYYPRLAISEIWPYRNFNKYEWEGGEDGDDGAADEEKNGIEDFYLGRPWIRVINQTSSDGWWALGKFTPQELPAVEAYFIKLKKEKKFCQVTLKPGTVIRADGAFQTQDPEHIKILKLPKKGLPPLVWCPEDKKGCKCKWVQPPAESYDVPTGEIHHAHGEPITIRKTANVRNWPN